MPWPRSARWRGADGMLWSLVKILIFVGLTAALAWFGGVLIESHGNFRMTGLGYEVTLGPLQAVIAGVLLVVAIYVLMRLAGLLIAVFRFVNGDETAISRYFDRNRERKGFEALADGMMALASGEGRVAMAKAARAEKFLHRPELTNLLAAQAAEMAGDRAKAEEVYKRLLQDDRTRFVGVRGIMKQKLSEGDTATALELAERAHALKPRHDETADVLLKLQAGKGDWQGARRTLGSKLRSGAVPRDLHRRRDAVLALSEAEAMEDDAQARALAIEANRLSPDLVPAAAAAARALVEEGNPRQATKVIRKAWDKSPHPDLAAAFAEIEPDETPDERLKRFQPLLRQHPEDEEVRLLTAELNIAGEDFAAARAALGNLPETHPTSRALALMAAVERGQGAEDHVVSAWLARAVSAPRGPAWVCENCHTNHAHWEPVCRNCAALDTLSWEETAQEEPDPAKEVILPLIIGPGPKTQPEPEAVSEAVEPEPEPELEPDPDAPLNLHPDMAEVEEQQK